MTAIASRAVGALGASLVALLVVAGGCAGGDDGNASGAQGSCETACANVMRCKTTGYQDSDLETLTQAECMDGCINYADASTRNCAAQNTDCVTLDDYCDVF